MNELRIEDKEFELLINGKNNSKHPDTNEIKLTANRCGDACLEVVEIVEDVSGDMYWSDASIWPDGELPKEGEDVEIQSGWNLILDIEETPIF